MGGCSNSSSSTPSAATKAPISITFPNFFTGTNVGAPAFQKKLAAFNAKYGSEIKVDIEDIPSDDAYVSKIKLLMTSGQTPDIINGKQGLYDLAVKSGAAVDLTSYINADSDWKASMTDEALASRTKNEKLYSIPDSVDVVGYFYNKDMFQKAGITPAKTWDEWFSNCDKLKAKGFKPLAMMTGENSWTTNLILASLIGTSGDAGNKFMNTMHPKNFNTPEVIDSLKKVQKMLQNYTTSDAMGAKYADAANNFTSGKAAIIANGPWMIADFSNKDKSIAGFDKNVACAAYPNSGLITSFREGYLICSKDKAHQDASAKFIKFLTDNSSQQIDLEMLSQLPISKNVKISDDFKKNNPVLSDLVNANFDTKVRYQSLDTINYANVTSAFSNLYSQLIGNKITAEEMAKSLSDTAAKNAD
jgi:raffinose/stachyose/melibiose transport system substrate-binding protein